MNYSTVRTAIETWVASATGSALRFYWAHRPRGYDTGRIIAEIMNKVPQGRDAISWDYDNTAPTGQELTPVARGNRTFTLQFRIETYSASNTEDAEYYAAQLIDSTVLPGNVATFKNASIGFRSVLANNTRLVVKNEREISTCILQLSFHSDFELEGTAIGYAEKWQVTSDLDGINPSKNIDELMP
jgi:hypothetical protein